HWLNRCRRGETNRTIPDGRGSVQFGVSGCLCVLSLSGRGIPGCLPVSATGLAFRGPSLHFPSNHEHCKAQVKRYQDLLSKTPIFRECYKRCLDKHLNPNAGCKTHVFSPLDLPPWLGGSQRLHPRHGTGFPFCSAKDGEIRKPFLPKV